MAGLINQIVHWIYPCTCELCGAGPLDKTYLCPSCEAAFTRPERPLCFRCGEPAHGSVAREDACPHCAGSGHHFDFARACYINEGKARELVLQFKYGGKIHLGRTLAASMAALWEEYGDVLSGGGWLLVPVPLHASKRRKRGYNQAEELAMALARLKGVKIVDALKRLNDGQSQTTMGREERFDHVRRLYVLREKQARLLRGRNVLLIDDVMTTGSTAEACARELKRGGASRVGVLSVLRSRMEYAGKRP